LNNSYSKENDIHIYLINHPDESKINQRHKELIKQIIKPTDCLMNLVETALNRLQLTKKQFIVIHIRVNDSCFDNDYTSITYKQILLFIAECYYL